MERHEKTRSDCGGEGTRRVQHSMETELLVTPSLSSTASSSSPSEDGFGSDVVFPAVQAQQHQLLQGDDDFGDFSADALLFLLEEEQEELLFTGLANEPLDLADLNFLEDPIENTQEDQVKRNGTNSRRQVAIAPAPCAASASQTTPVETKASDMSRCVADLTTDAGATTSSSHTGAKPSTGGRKRVKDELEYLRQHVNDLEGQLCQLEPKNHARFDSQEHSLVTPSHTTLVASSSSLWKRVASHQLDERKKAEAENTRLRDLLEGQLRVAKSLAKTLRKRTDLDSVRSECANQVRLFKRADQNAATRGVFACLEETIGPLVRSASAVLAEVGFSNLNEVRDNQVKTDAMGRLFLEVVDSNVLPFDLEATSSSFWKLFSHSSNQERYGVISLQAMELTSDTLSAQFSVNLPVRRTDSALFLKGHVFGRRFIEENRVVMVWSSLSKSDSKLFGSEQIVVRETGWTVIEAIPPESTEDGEASSTSIKTVVRLTSDVGDLDLDADLVPESQSNHVGVLTELVLSSFSQNFGAMHRMVDNIVMVEMIALTI